jgi:DNA-binding response OmpR family regulator
MDKKVLFINNFRASYVIPELLSQAGFAVQKAVGDDAALHDLERGAFDIIIAMESPNAPSYRLCEKIRSVTGTPIIVISPEAETEACVRAINAGADYFMRKPFGPLEFIARINSLLHRSARQPGYRRDLPAYR